MNWFSRFINFLRSIGILQSPATEDSIIEPTKTTQKNDTSAKADKNTDKPEEKPTDTSQATNYPFKNLIFKGGGIRGLSYLGALEVLFERGVVQQAERVGGASAGAITALVTALNFDFEETKKIANSLDYTQIAGVPDFFATRDVNDPEYFDEDAVPRGLLTMLSNVGATISEVKFLFSAFGLHTSDYIYEWFGTQVAKLTGKPDASFKEFVDAGGKDLYIAVTNISNHSGHICSAQTTPDLEVAEAVRTSMSIPIFFQSIDFENVYFKGYFGDGGVMNNYPINLFDHGLDANLETLGLFSYSTTKPQSFPDKYSLSKFAGDTVASLLAAQDWYIGRQKEDVARTVQISSYGISPTDFDIKPGDDKYNQLYNAGKEGALNYFKAYDNKDDATLQQPLWIPKMLGFA